jgi:glutamine synthetase
MQRIAEIYGNHLFNDKVMRERLPKEIYQKLQRTIKEGLALEPHLATIVANAMKDWAIENGATHFTHWFQPMTGRTGEKHEALLNITEDGVIIEEFSGKNLIIGEGDASSFPNGGLRATFEARGYTTWDCTSPAFLKEGDGTKTLCIPTAFCSYNGEALDKKTPLLRSMQVLEKATKRLLKIFGNEPKRVYTTVGGEQEYFLIDKRLYQQRRDIIYTGRTLFGAEAPKGQDLRDHYYGSIKDHIANFMHDLDIELWKLGITAKTKHNEVAPGQYEVAPIFTTVNIATDQNQLTMEVLETVANRHQLVCLLHEKPFEYVNGSGKHNNWSIVTSDGVNLLEPGETPHDSLQFLLILAAMIKAIDTHPELVRISASSYSNDFRLGGHEAPPRIISMFIGEQLEDILNQIESGNLHSSKVKNRLDTGVITLPKLRTDVTDRNRTSPFAFTGNKFEFRMVGSSQTLADPNIVLNTIVADSFNEIADRLEGSSNLFEDVKDILQEIVTKHKKIIFNGNGYSKEWAEEASRRGLPVLNTTIDALPHLISEKSLDVFTRNEVFSKSELYSRYEIRLEDYMIKAHIEAKTMVHMMRKEILPSANKYLLEVTHTFNSLNSTGLGLDLSSHSELITEIHYLINESIQFVKQLDDQLSLLNGQENTIDKARLYQENVLDLMKKIRIKADQLELLVSREHWPFPTYGDLLFRI